MFKKSHILASIFILLSVVYLNSISLEVFASASSFAISGITANCNGTGQVTYSGTIPQGGFTLELMDKAADNSGPFISTVPPTVITITSGGSPVDYIMPLTNWSAPHYRVDSNFNTKSPSLNCDAASTPTPTPTSTPVVTPTSTPTVTPTPTPSDPGDNDPTPTPTQPSPTATAGTAPTVTPTPTQESNNGGSNDNNSNSNSNSSSSSNNQSQGQVLGAATEFTGTGTAEDVLASIAGMLGVVLTGAGVCIKKLAKS